MKHELILLGKIKDTFIQKGLDEYAGRLQHYTDFSITTLKDRTGGYKDPKKITQKQGELLLGAVGSGARMVVLDAKGKQYSSEEFAEKIELLEVQGVRRLCYLIGGPDGHSQEVLKRANLLLSLSKMTFTHDMARLLLVEQLYRAYTIKAGEKYHK